MEADKTLKTAYIELRLTLDGEPISEPMTYQILPSCLHKLHDFAFLNSLGGWSSFNFGTSQTDDFSSKSSTIYKTHTPQRNISSAIESIHSKEVEEKFTVESMPLREKDAQWLKEMSSSIAVYEIATKRYILIEDLKVKTSTKDELVSLQMRYHYSDSYNGYSKN